MPYDSPTGAGGPCGDPKVVEARMRHFRTLFISDVHLGARGCQAELLLDFLRYHDADTIYLVGDIVDGWQLRSGWYWPQAHNDVVQKLLRKARKGARVIYVPGNHDEFLRDYYGTHFGGIEVKETAIHEAADGRRYLVVHGDVFDLVVKHARWVAVAVGEAQGQERGQLYRRLRADAGRRGAPPPRRRRHLRPHPSRRDPREV